jgi:hypothetical protein
MITRIHLTDGIFETGAYGVPIKSQNPTVGTNNYPPFRNSTKNQVFIPASYFLLSSPSACGRAELLKTQIFFDDFFDDFF